MELCFFEEIKVVLIFLVNGLWDIVVDELEVLLEDFEMYEIMEKFF